MHHGPYCPQSLVVSADTTNFIVDPTRHRVHQNGQEYVRESHRNRSFKWSTLSSQEQKQLEHLKKRQKGEK